MANAFTSVMFMKLAVVVPLLNRRIPSVVPHSPHVCPSTLVFEIVTCIKKFEHVIESAAPMYAG